MRVLQLCKKFPFPKKDGESFAVTNLAVALSKLEVNIDLLAFNTTKHYVQIDELPKSFNHYNQVFTVDIDNKIKPLDAIKNLFSSESFHVSRFTTESFKSKLEEILKSNVYDAVILETIYMTPYIDIIRSNSSAMCLLRAHNIEYEIWDRVAANSYFPKSTYLNNLSKKLKRFESSIVSRMDYLLCLTNRDLEEYKRMGYQGESYVLPIGIDTQELDRSSVRKRSIDSKGVFNIGFIGSLDWMPNIDGLKWFLDNVWHRLSAKYNLNLNIAGRNTPDWLLNINIKGVNVHGEVESAEEFTKDQDLMIVPLFSGSGMRVKIIESMSYGVPVVSTDIGIEGIDAQDGIAYLKANTSDEFRSTISKYSDMIIELQEIGTEGRKYVLKNFDSERNAKNLLKIIEKLKNK